MSLKSFLTTLAFCSTLLSLSNAFGQKATLEAEVKGVDGRPSKAAEVRIERRDKKSGTMVMKTDTRGRLAATSLEAGTYKVTATVEGGINSSQIIKVQASTPSLLAFDMSKTAAVTGKAKKRYVWLPAETGTHLGGRWVETGDEPTTSPSDRNIERINGNTLDKFQHQTYGQPPPAIGGR